jgi:beta-mannosidase
MAAREVIQPGKWHFKRANDHDDKLLPCAQFPTNIHLDLLHHKLIPDPFIGKNELLVQWVGDTKWTYTTTFEVDDVKGKTASLSFEGLDTFATVIFNGEKVLESDNMFIPYRVDVSELLKSSAGEPNVLSITFDVASERGWELVKAHPEHKWECWNGDNSRLPIRKAQYHFVSRPNFLTKWCSSTTHK